ncbi:hypothetical protein F3K39_19050 [Streptomyces sp. LBUM 1479]|uniref:hypothetical protein n=1 Tax=Streptomyces scabiei TaxID=1930 RepID=UPI001B3129E6|nr:hypothetical protein [Streptomyces sp. LBUM 1475]MBP5930167.1 hypothetical protein [Streptomyces sp. LBUM 1479]QTU63148.1 hypothetical protein F3K22_20900 [Streptomyces sp. LBUM 1475]
MSMDDLPDRTDRSGCGSTRHCADHGWCHRCAPERSEAEARARAAIAPLEKAIRAAKAQERAEIRTAALLEGADAVFALTFDECGRADSDFGSFQHAWDLGTIDATHKLRRLARTEPGEQPTEVTAQEDRDEQQAQAHLDQLAGELPDRAQPTLDGAMRIVESWFVDVNDGHGFDASDLVHQLAEAGYRLPSDGPS